MEIQSVTETDMNLKSALIATAFAMSAVTVLPVAAQTRNAERTASVPADLQASIKTALHRISASPDANSTLIEAVSVRYDDGVRSLLIQNGVNEDALSRIAIDTDGPDAGPRMALPDTIYFAVTTTHSGTPLGLVYMGHPYGWVDWNTFDPWAYF